MDIYELVLEMKVLERRLTLYEEKYGILSEDFYAALMTGKLARYDGYDETRADFSRWKGTYETWLRRKEAYSRQMQQHDVADTLPPGPKLSRHIPPPQACATRRGAPPYSRTTHQFHASQSPCAPPGDRGPDAG